MQHSVDFDESEQNAKYWNELADIAVYLENRAYQLSEYGKRIEKKGI